MFRNPWVDKVEGHLFLFIFMPMLMLLVIPWPVALVFNLAWYVLFIHLEAPSPVRVDRPSAD